MRHEQPVVICADPGCRWSGLPEARHFEAHNPPCARLFSADDGAERLCALGRGHSGDHAPRAPIGLSGHVQGTPRNG